MMPHIYDSLRGYPGHWVHSLDGGPKPDSDRVVGVDGP